MWLPSGVRNRKPSGSIARALMRSSSRVATWGSSPMVRGCSVFGYSFTANGEVVPVIFLPGSVTTRRTVRVAPSVFFFRSLAPPPAVSVVGRVRSRGWRPRISPHRRPVSAMSSGMGAYQSSIFSMTASLIVGVMIETRRRGMVSRSTPAQGLELR